MFISPNFSFSHRAGVPVPQCAVLAAVRQWQRHHGWRMLGTLLPIWWPQRQNPGCYRFRSLSQAGGVTDVSLKHISSTSSVHSLLTQQHWLWKSSCGWVMKLCWQLDRLYLQHWLQQQLQTKTFPHWCKVLDWTHRISWQLIHCTSKRIYFTSLLYITYYHVRKIV